MGSGPSKAVQKAFKYYCGGMSVLAAATKAGCDQSTLRRYPEYVSYIKNINPARADK